MARLLAFFLASMLVPAGPAPARADDVRQLTGSVSYMQRMALPPGSEAAVAAEGRFGATLGEVVVDPDGRQVPLPFSITVPSALSGQVSAVIRVQDRPRWFIDGIEFEAGRDDVDLGALTLEPVSPMTFARDYVCGDIPVSVGVLDERLILRIEEREIVLEQVRAASGVRYEAVGEDDAYVWNKGRAITIGMGGRDFPECREVLPAEKAHYRARGNEPGWHVTLDPETATVVADYGKISRETARPPAQVVPGAYEFEMPEAGATLRIAEQLCRDNATGMPHPDTAQLALDDRVLRGCGGDPADLLTAGPWRITALEEGDLVNAESPSLEFMAPDSVAGGSGCNRVMGSFNLTGEGLQFGPLASTAMACADPLMAQERRMLDALGQITRFDVTADGALHLIGGPDDAVLIEARPAD